ncbi:MerR family transcriptional regulator [Rhodoferax koreense]|uniref:MerR family transcriptional regulator n=1 Tax=Rhodoferax koreensis TaxID=1842727 RepID=A0A1P8JTK1_9BURK|nr:chaperone modulator CbpM [Rhodoferax koreense]APW37031.1 MerR family transcriptional regulator [Rhodoferax koreense]
MNQNPGAGVTGPIHEEQQDLTLADLCQHCRVRTEYVVEMVEEGVLSPEGTAPQTWRFTGVHVQRARVAVRLQRDLGVNPAGAALALQLLDEIEALKARLQTLSR